LIIKITIQSYQVKTFFKYLLPFTFLIIVGNLFFEGAHASIPYNDLKYYSQVFGKEKTYRIYLPEGYEQSAKNYPVIYFFHGWGGRYFKDDSARLEYEKLGKLVNKYQVILVMWDGSIEESEPRPYNIGSHLDLKYNIQMKDYFPEFVAHIDSAYRTFTDRDHRGIIGFSMGGFLSFYMSGKYPDKVSAAVSIVGSPEFFVGLPENHTLYQMRYTFENLCDVASLFFNRTNCPMSGLNDEVNNGAVWSEIKNYEYHKLKGDHQVDKPGETKIFESSMRFVTDRFKNPVAPHKRWSHYDLCSEFDIWGYSVKSKKSEPGFICLKNVDKNGFGFYTQKWLPEGPSLKNYKTSVTTAPIYKTGTKYKISVYSLKKNITVQFNCIADENGSITLELTGEDCEITISEKADEINFSAFGYQLPENRKFLKINQKEEFLVHIINRGGIPDQTKKILLTLSCADSSLNILSPKQILTIPAKGHVLNSNPIKIFCNKTPPEDGSPEWLRIKVSMQIDTLSFCNVLVMPVFYDVSKFTNIKVDDGRVVASTQDLGDFNNSANDSIYGTGNADGIVSSGERIMLYENEHRLRLYTDDPYVIAEDETLVDELLPAKWPDGYSISSVVKIAGDCPAGHEIEFMAHYETKTFMPMYRQVEWGRVKIRVVMNPNNKTY